MTTILPDTGIGGKNIHQNGHLANVWQRPNPQHNEVSDVESIHRVLSIPLTPYIFLRLALALILLHYGDRNALKKG